LDQFDELDQLMTVTVCWETRLLDIGIFTLSDSLCDRLSGGHLAEHPQNARHLTPCEGIVVFSSDGDMLPCAVTRLQYHGAECNDDDDDG
jgi:hypothetical protein